MEPSPQFWKHARDTVSGPVHQYFAHVPAGEGEQYGSYATLTVKPATTFHYPETDERVRKGLAEPTEDPDMPGQTLLFHEYHRPAIVDELFSSENTPHHVVTKLMALAHQDHGSSLQHDPLTSRFSTPIVRKLTSKGMMQRYHDPDEEYENIINEDSPMDRGQGGFVAYGALHNAVHNEGLDVNDTIPLHEVEAAHNRFFRKLRSAKTLPELTVLNPHIPSDHDPNQMTLDEAR